MQSMPNGFTQRTVYSETRVEIPKEFAINALQTQYPYLLELQRIFTEIGYGCVTVDFTIREGKAEGMDFYNEKRTWRLYKPSLVENLKVDNIDNDDNKE